MKLLNFKNVCWFKDRKYINAQSNKVSNSFTGQINVFSFG